MPDPTVRLWPILTAAEERASKTVHGDAYERGQGDGMLNIVSAIRKALNTEPSFTEEHFDAELLPPVRTTTVVRAQWWRGFGVGSVGATALWLVLDLLARWLA